MSNLIHLPVNNPGRFGLNKQESAATLSLDWATKMHNIVFDSQNNLSARKGTARTNTDTVTDPVKQIFEYIDSTGTSQYICTTDTNIYKKDSTSLTTLVGTMDTPTSGHWKFVNFSGSVIGAQSGHELIFKTSTSDDFDEITLVGTQTPSTAANELLSAYGRLWTLDGQDLKYSDLLSYTDWNSVYDLTEYWGNGSDVGVALIEFNGNIVVFGKNNIIIYNATLGPDELVKTEVINGIGCIARDSVQVVGNDIWFLSNSGIRSLSRVVQEKSLPLTDISKNVRDYMLSFLPTDPDDWEDIKSTYSETEGFYLLSFPASSIVFCFDAKRQLEDGSARASTFEAEWYSLFSSSDRDMHVGTTGYLNEYSGYLDNVSSDGTGGDNYPFCYYSPWTNLDFLDPMLASRLKILKRMSTTIFASASQILQFHWFTDFSDSPFTAGISIEVPGHPFTWNTSTWLGGDTWGPLVNLVKSTTTMKRTCQYLSFGIYADVNGASFSLQSINLQAKIGRASI